MARKQLEFVGIWIERFLDKVPPFVWLPWLPTLFGMGVLLLLAISPALLLLLVVRLILRQLNGLLAFQKRSEGENWATSLGWFIPRKYRNDIIGDILEDCAEMRETGCTERQIRFNVVYQWLIAIVTLVPTAVKTSITDILKQVLSPPK